MSYKTSLKSNSFDKKRVKDSLNTVGIIFPCYGYERVSYSLPIKDVQFMQVRSFPLHRFLKSNFYKNTPIVIPDKVDFLHTWNAIPVGFKPFFISFENELPRYFGKIFGWQKSLGFSILKSNRCYGILALSDVAAELARKEMEYNGYPEIASKISVFRGGVSVVIDKKKSRRMVGGVLKVIFVGGDIFPKGFIPAFNALQKLVDSETQIELTVIGQFKKGGYVLKEYSPEPSDWNERLKSASWVTHYETLPNEDVLKEMVSHDLLISPSYDETLGWAVIEAGLLGVPAITTNVFALPELVKHNESGYVIDLKLGKQQRWQGVWEEGDVLKREIDDANELIYQGVMEAINCIVGSPKVLESWSINSKKHMTNMYDVDMAAEELLRIYQKVVK